MEPDKLVVTLINDFADGGSISKLVDLDSNI